MTRSPAWCPLSTDTASIASTQAQPLRGTLQRGRGPYEWMRIGFATARFSWTVLGPAVLALILLAIWLYLEIPASGLRPVYFILLYLIAVLVYLNLGVWLHEHAHCLAYRGTVHAQQVQITYIRKYLLILGGFYRVRGPLDFRIIQRALLGPLYLTFGLLLAGLIGSLLLPGWWLPLLLSFVVISLIDMLHDLYMVSQIRRVGPAGKYWDRGQDLEVVWRP